MSWQDGPMSHVRVSAGRTLLESYVKTPAVGLCELVWNAFDEDATTVNITVEYNDLDGPEKIVIQDNGSGMTYERAELAFSRIGDSWKMPAGTTSPGGRSVHGRHGRGRFAAFALGERVTWFSTAKQINGNIPEAIAVAGTRSSLDDFVIERIDGDTDAAPGTRIEISGLTSEAISEFDKFSGLRDRLLSEFALQLDRHPDFSIDLVGTDIDASAVTISRTPIELELPEGLDGEATLMVIEWSLSSVERRLYLCDQDQTIVGEMPPGVHASGAEFTAYLTWSGFTRNDAVILEGDIDTPSGQVLQIARQALRQHLSESSRKREAETVERWKKEGVYPYKGEAKDAADKATRDAFNVVALAASRTVDEAKSRTTRGLALSLLKETFENDPESLLPILKEFSRLPISRIEELRLLLERTTLTHLIALGKEVGGRADFLQGLNAILFDRQTRARLQERRQLHRILAHETWIFGEEWSLTGDDQRLNEVLKNFLEKLGDDVSLASSDDEPILREDGKIAIPDLVLGRQLETQENHFSQLVVELKRPNHTLNDEDVSQLRSYASTITRHERFDQPNVHWDFWLVGNKTSAAVDEMRDGSALPVGVVQQSRKYRIMVKTWAEIIGEAEHRLKFVQRSLRYESGRDQGLESMRAKYAKYLPAEDEPDKEEKTA